MANLAEKLPFAVQTGVFLVEARRIELLSENPSDRGSPSAVCDQHSLTHKFTDKLVCLVASFVMAGSKLCLLTFTAK